ncbi:hypothetical protein GBA52_004985 [Prunus armeniaca]|nr:hypothetical protein GBA52_004985 [Prunus armeniaca]
MALSRVMPMTKVLRRVEKEKKVIIHSRLPPLEKACQRKRATRMTTFWRDSAMRNL